MGWRGGGVRGRIGSGGGERGKPEGPREGEGGGKVIEGGFVFVFVIVDNIIGVRVPPNVNKRFVEMGPVPRAFLVSIVKSTYLVGGSFA